MKIGIVGSEGAKFTPVTEELAWNTIYALISMPAVAGVISGECHLGGIDIWAKECADFLGVPFSGFPPKTHSWSGGYKERNIQIAEASDKVVCITLRVLPASFKGKWRFDKCYHCHADHVKSGGCWTVKYARSIGKQGEVIVI